MAPHKVDRAMLKAILSPDIWFDGEQRLPTMIAPGFKKTGFDPDLVIYHRHLIFILDYI